MKIVGQKLFQLLPKDLIKGFIMAIFSVFVTYVGQAIQSGNFPTDSTTWILEAKIALGAGIAYLLKNFLTNSNDQFMKAEPKADAIIK